MDLFRADSHGGSACVARTLKHGCGPQGFYEFTPCYGSLGCPAGIVLTRGGRYAVCLLDRNGLRPRALCRDHRNGLHYHWRSEIGVGITSLKM